MKKIKYLIFILIFTTGSIHAQSWTVGIPVNQLYIDYPDPVPVTVFCDTMSGIQAVFHLPLPVVTGVSFYVFLDYVSFPGDSVILSQGMNFQTLHLNDSMLLISGAPDSSVILRYAGVETQASVKFKAIGTPLVAGQIYACPSVNQGWFFQGIGCLFPNYADMTAVCTVQNTTGLNENADSFSVLVYPNPVKNILTIQWSGKKKSDEVVFLLVNPIGQIIKRYPLKQELSALDIDKIIPGIYIYRIEIGNDIIKRGKLIIE